MCHSDWYWQQKNKNVVENRVYLRSTHFWCCVCMLVTQFLRQHHIKIPNQSYTYCTVLTGGVYNVYLTVASLCRNHRVQIAGQEKLYNLESTSDLLIQLTSNSVFKLHFQPNWFMFIFNSRAGNFFIQFSNFLEKEFVQKTKMRHLDEGFLHV